MNINPPPKAYSTLFPSSEVIDKLSILLLKLEKIEGLSVKEEGEILQQCDLALSILCSKLKQLWLEDSFPASKTKQLFSFISSLIHSNTIQWGYEDQVRAEQTKDAAVGAREQNETRVELKNSINELLGDIKERKQYPKIE